MYKIIISYQTGDSFGSHKTENEVGYSFETKEEAQLFETYIKEHYEMFQKYEKLAVPFERIAAEYENKPWFFKVPGEALHMALCTMLYKEQWISCFWCGYFEVLEEITIELDTKLN